ncbi:MAG: hypothetical protein AB1546_13955 [bacterium]
MRAMMRRMFLCFVILVLSSTLSAAKPGPVVFTLMERFEGHSDTPSSIRDVSGETYAYTMLSLFRKLDEDVFGNIFYINKLSLDDGETAGNIGGISVTKKHSKHLSMNYSYSYTSNPERNVVPSSDTDRFSIAANYTINPNTMSAPSYSILTTYSTGTDFSYGRTIAEKFTVKDKFSKKSDYAVAYQYVYGLNNSEQFTNQYSLDLNFNITKLDRISFGYLFIDNIYSGAAYDDNIVRLSYYRTIKQ